MGMMSELRRDNYESWRRIMEHYLKGEGLWGIIENPEEDHLPSSNGDGESAWNKNHCALFQIKNNCGPELLSYILAIESAKTAWNKLATLCSQNTHVVLDLEHGPVVNALLPDASFHKLAKEGKWAEAYKLIEQDDHKLYDTHLGGKTPLHLAIIDREEYWAEKLVKRMPPALLEKKDDTGFTALAYAIDLGINVKIAQLMVSKNPSLVMSCTNHYSVPMLQASAGGHKDMARYLYEETSPDLLSQDGCRIGALQFINCLKNQIFDVALKVLQDCPLLSLVQNFEGTSPVYELARMPGAFISGSQLGLCDKFIYQVIQVNCSSLGCGQGSTASSVALQRTSWFQFFLDKFKRLKGIHEQKSTHIQASELLKCISERLKNCDIPILELIKAKEAMLEAAKNGIEEFIMSLGEAKPELLSVHDLGTNRGILSYAMLHGHGKIVNYICEQNLSAKYLRASYTDSDDNNMLHLAAISQYRYQRDNKFGGALEMQREVNWFKETERLVDPKCIDALNRDNKSPRQLFTQEHEKLMQEAEKWSKENATSFSLIDILIITIMFSALLTVPGGNNQSSGFPIFIDKENFTLYLICVLLSLVLASLSLLTFIGILTGHHSENDYHKILPMLFLIGLSTLCLSAITMMITACAVVSLILSGHPQIINFAILLISVPVAIFALLQIRLFVQFFNSTCNLEFFSTMKMKHQKSKYH